MYQFKKYKLKNAIDKLYKNGYYNNSLLNLNPSDGAIDMLLANRDKINWNIFYNNSNERVLDFIYEVDILDKFSDYCLSSKNNKKVIDFLKNKQYRISWSGLCSNENDEAIKLLIENPKQIDWKIFSINSNNLAVDLIIKNLNNQVIDWRYLCSNTNPRIIEILNMRREMIYFYNFCSNTSDDAMELLEKIILEEGYGNVNWFQLAINTNKKACQILIEYINSGNTCLACSSEATYIMGMTNICRNNNDLIVDFLLKNKHYLQLNYNDFAMNTNEKAIKFIWNKLKNIDRENRIYNEIKNGLRLNKNPLVIDLMIDLDMFDIIPWNNEGIFEYTYDYVEIRKRQSVYLEELMENVFHPRNYQKFYRDWKHDEFEPI